MILPNRRVVRCAPKNQACPHCGKLGRRKRHLFRRIRSLAYQQEAWLLVHYAEYQAAAANTSAPGPWMSRPNPTTTARSARLCWIVSSSTA
jgi:hypothetical protein